MASGMRRSCWAPPGYANGGIASDHDDHRRTPLIG
jgi:H-NS histone family